VSLAEPPDKPILAVDVDGVISLFGFEGPPEEAPCEFQLIDGMAHCISLEVGERLRRLVPHYELIWATGWEDRANDYLLHLLGLPELPVLRFGRSARFGSAHWKLTPIGEYAVGRRLAWIDDSLDESCHEWARERSEPTLLVPTESHIGLEDAHVDTLIGWADRSGADVAGESEDERIEAISLRMAGLEDEDGAARRGGRARALRSRFRRRLD